MKKILKQDHVRFNCIRDNVFSKVNLFTVGIGGGPGRLKKKLSYNFMRFSKLRKSVKSRFNSEISLAKEMPS